MQVVRPFFFNPDTFELSFPSRSAVCNGWVQVAHQNPPPSPQWNAVDTKVAHPPTAQSLEETKQVNGGLDYWIQTTTSGTAEHKTNLIIHSYWPINRKDESISSAG